VNLAIKIKDIAKAAGVSEATISLAMNGNPLVKDETRKMVLKLADEMGYVPSAVARRLALKNSKQLGIIVPDIENVYYSTLVKECNRYVRSVGYGLNITISDNEVDQEKAIVDEMIENRVEGVIVVPLNIPNADVSHIQKLKQYKIPFVFTGDYYAGIDGIHVMSDLEDGMYELASILMNHGHRDIVYLTGQSGVPSLDLREQGFMRAAKEFGIEPIIYHLPKVDYPSACIAAQELLLQKQLTEAVICVNDMMALSLVNTFQKHALSVPDDILVTGFDDTIFAAVSAVSLTTVRQDIPTLAQRSIDLLIDEIENKTLNRGNVYLKTEVILRDSGGK
jgi:Transcriptional regulators